MRIDIIPIKDLTENLKQCWLSIQASNPNLVGPCFHPELFIAVGKSAPDVYVAIIYNKNKLVGFLPFLKDKILSVAKPIDFCDYEAIIGPQHQNWNMDIILKKSGLNTWEFTALADFENIKSKKGWFKRIDSMRVDLTAGFEEYSSYLKKKEIGFERSTVKKRLLRDVGPIRFVPISNDIEVLHCLLRWKILRHNRELDWARLATKVLEYIYYLKNSSLSGVLSGLYAGDNLVATHFAMRYQGILQGLLMAFNPDFSKYSPGFLLLPYLFSEHKALQYNIFDFGPGEQLYKEDLSNSNFPIMQGYFRVGTFKDKLKSINWLYQGLRPFVKLERKIVTKLNNKRNKCGEIPSN